MMKSELIWRTATGQRAWECPDSGLPAGYRRILGLVEAPTSAASILAKLTDCSAKQIEDWLYELETLCFIHVSRIDLKSSDLLAA